MKKIYFLLFFILPFLLCAQTPGDIAQNFGTYPGFNNSVTTIATQADGKILMGGSFTAYKGLPENYIIRLNADGTKDTTFNSGTEFNQQVAIIKVQSDGKILVGGNFTTYNGNTENYMIRLNTDGTKDTTFNIGSGFNGSVSTIAIQTDGTILVGGYFTTYKGLTENRIIRLNTNGTEDTTFNAGSGFNGSVSTIATQADGKIVVGGNFTIYNGSSNQNGIIRLNANGTKDTTFNTGVGFQIKELFGSNLVGGIVYTISIQAADGKILVGGYFTFYKGSSSNRIIRLNTDGTKDATFNTGSGFNDTVYATAIQTDGKILASGTFTTYNGSTENRIIRLNTDGTEDTTFNAGTGFNNIVYTLAINGGKILVGGYFSTYKGLLENRIIQLNTDGTEDTTFIAGGTGFDSTNNASIGPIATQTDGKIVLGGYFSSYKGLTENRIIRLNADNTKDTTFNTGTGFNNFSNTIAIQTDGKILVGGYFTTYKGVTENYIIRLNTDGTKDTAFNAGTGFNGTVNTISIQTDGKILVGGNFSTYNGITENRIIRLNTDGTKDTTFNTGTGFDWDVYTIATQTDGKILVGGYFTTYNGSTENRIIRLNADGTEDTTFNTGTGFNNGVYTIVTQTDGKILVGGYFTTYKGLTENYIIRLNPDGSEDTTFIAGTGFNGAVSAIVPQTNGKILVGGGFTTYKDDNSSAGVIALHLGASASLGTSSFTDSNSFTVYPNPSEGIFNLDIENSAAIQIFDINGKQILSRKIAVGTSQIDLSGYNSGIYILKATDVNNKSETTKLVKK